MVLQTICTGQVFSKMTVAKCHDSDDVMKLGIELTRQTVYATFELSHIGKNERHKTQNYKGGYSFENLDNIWKSKRQCIQLKYFCISDDMY